ncbi:unnamed protein product [Victoria cruziana]
MPSSLRIPATSGKPWPPPPIGPIAKDSIQPQVPLRLPCYDFTPVEDPTVGVVGGVYRAQVHIHRGMLICDY